MRDGGEKPKDKAYGSIFYHKKDTINAWKKTPFYVIKKMKIMCKGSTICHEENESNAQKYKALSNIKKKIWAIQ